MKWLTRCLYLQFRILTLTANKQDMLSLDKGALVWGLVTVWVAGIGRYWDAPMEPMIMRSGAPSVIYIFVLAAFLWLLIYLLRPANWSYMRLVTYISLTGMPAFIYAIPFERIYGVERGAEYNAMALVVVASWRVLMLFNYLVRVSKLNILSVAFALLLPLMVIVSTLMSFNRLGEVVEMMGGIRTRYVVQSDEKAAIANFPEIEKQQELERERQKAASNSNNPISNGNPAYRNAQSSSTIGLIPERKPIIVNVEGKPVEFESARKHTFRGREHVVYALNYQHPIPKGFREVERTDPEYNSVDPVLAVTYPVAKFMEMGLLPVFLGFLAAVLYGWLKPKPENDQLG
jgi:hypothetical protein